MRNMVSISDFELVAWLFIVIYTFYRTLPKVKIIFPTSLRSQIRCQCLVAKFSVIKLELSLFLYKMNVLT